MLGWREGGLAEACLLPVTTADSEELLWALKVTVVSFHCQLGPYEDRVVGGLSLLLNTAEGTF